MNTVNEGLSTSKTSSRHSAGGQAKAQLKPYRLKPYSLPPLRLMRPRKRLVSRATSRRQHRRLGRFSTTNTTVDETTSSVDETSSTDDVVSRHRPSTRRPCPSTRRPTTPSARRPTKPSTRHHTLQKHDRRREQIQYTQLYQISARTFVILVILVDETSKTVYRHPR